MSTLGMSAMHAVVMRDT